MPRRPTSRACQPASQQNEVMQALKLKKEEDARLSSQREAELDNLL
jgi:hypothetical protein